MAQALTKVLTTAAFAGHPGLHVVNVDFTTEAYATATGGVTVAAGTLGLKFDWNNVQVIQAVNVTGGLVPLVTKTTTPGQVTIRFYVGNATSNGMVEVADGNLSNDFTLLFFEGRSQV